MPINYDEIIKKAEARRAALQEYADAMASFSSTMSQLAEVFHAAQWLVEASNGLDTEATQLLDHMAVHRVKMYAERLISVHTALDSVAFNGESKTYRQYLSEMIERTK